MKGRHFSAWTCDLKLLLQHGTTHCVFSPPADPTRERRVVLLGRPGGGRSSSGNTIRGPHRFESGSGFNSVSTQNVCQSATVEGCKVTVADTPGFTDEVLSPDELYLEIMKMMVTASPGPHAFIIVVRIGQITPSDIQLYELLPQLFTTEALRYSMVLFTHGDKLKGQNLEELIQSNRHVSELVSFCGGRFCVFDNDGKRSREQVRTFLKRADEKVSANAGQQPGPPPHRRCAYRVYRR